MGLVDSNIRIAGATSPSPDYSLLSTWEDDIPADIETEGNRYQANCYADWGASGLLDNVTISNDHGVVNATNNIVITAPESERHNGIVGSGFVIKVTANFLENIEILSPYTVVEYIEALNTSASGHAIYCSGVTEYSVTIESCIAKAVPGTGILVNRQIVKNSFVYDSTTGISGANVFGPPNTYNCTVANCATGFWGGTNGGSERETFELSNCVAYNCTTSYDVNVYATPKSYNNAASDASSDTPPGTDPFLTDVVAGDFENTTNDDYHLASGSNLIGEGLNLIDNYPSLSDPQLDIDGDEWPGASGGAWDIGFDYYVSAGGTVIPTNPLFGPLGGPLRGQIS